MCAAVRNPIKETKDIRDILNLITNDTWAFKDLDNTIMESSTELGSDQWFATLICHANNKKESFDSVIAIYQAVQHHVRTQAVEPVIIKIIKALQDCGVPVIGLTARDASLIDTTFRQLDEVGIDFSRRRSVNEENIPLFKDNKLLATYHNGIIFCNGNDKGDCLTAFLQQCSHRPQHAIMVDDKEKHVAHVRKALEALGIRFDGLHYRLLDEKVKNFDMKVANQQLAMIKHKLPSSVQTIIDRLELVSESKESKDAKAENFHPYDHTKPSLKRKREEDNLELHTARDLLDRPTSALSYFAPKRRRLLEPKVLQEPSASVFKPING